MGRRATQPQVANRRPEPREAGHRPVEEELFEGQLALEDVAFGQARRSLDVERRLDIPEEDRFLEPRRELADPVDDRIAERLTLVVPGPELRGELVRRVLDEAAHDVLPGR